MLIVPLAFTDQIGFAVLERSAWRPDDHIVAILGHFADTIAVVLATAWVFQERLRTIEELQRPIGEQHQLQATVLELAPLLLPLLPGVLVLPLIGVIDALRAERIWEAEGLQMALGVVRRRLVHIDRRPFLNHSSCYDRVRPNYTVRWEREGGKASLATYFS